MVSSIHITLSQIWSAWLRDDMSSLHTYNALLMSFNFSTSVASCLLARWTPVLYAICGFISIKPNKSWLSEDVLESSPSLSIIWLPLCIIILVRSCQFYRVSMWVYPCFISFMSKSEFIIHGFCSACVPNGISPAFWVIAVRCISYACNYVHSHS